MTKLIRLSGSGRQEEQSGREFIASVFLVGASFCWCLVRETTLHACEIH